MKISYCSKSDIGIKFPVNSTALADKITRNGHVFVVAEGKPVTNEGANASKLAVQSVIEYFEQDSYENIYLSLFKAFEFANEQVYRFAINSQQLRKVGVHCSIVVVREEGAYYGHVGNAKVCLKSGNQFYKLTKDQGFVDVQPYGNNEHAQSPVKLPVSLGVFPSIEPSICNKPILGKQGDVIIHATDGVFKSFTTEKLSSLITYQSINTNLLDVIGLAKSSGTAENLTIQLLAVTEGNEVVSKTFVPVDSKANDEEEGHESKKYLVSLAGGDRKKMIKIGAIICAFFIVIWYIFRTPQDDTDKVLEDAGEVIKADTTNQHQDLEDLMEYEKPKKEKEEEEDQDVSEDTEMTDDESTTEESTTESSDENAVDEPETPKNEEPKKEESKSSKGGGGVHVVKSGDNLGRIAEKYHVKMDALRKANNLSNDQINIGQELKIPN
jgi:serine/threonine protein phosphatase PrpC/LysM repeat protein